MKVKEEENGMVKGGGIYMVRGWKVVWRASECLQSPH